MKKIELVTSKESITIDNETSNNLKNIMKEEEDTVLSKFPEESFQRIFWMQQKKASSTPDKRGFRWHPLMIKWCLYLRHLSSKAYETLRFRLCLFTITMHPKGLFSLC